MPNRREIYDALTSDSSRDGCDGDWRSEVLGNASSGDLDFVREEIRRGSEFHTDKELRTSLIRDGKM